jgi:cation transport protein ChaC
MRTFSAFLVYHRRMATAFPLTHHLSRETVQAGAWRAHITAVDPTMELLSDAEHRRSVDAMLRDRPDGGGDVWLFAYGSLIWNPMVHFVAKRIATVPGYHRCFCLWTHLYRGSPGAPGLVLGLVPGGTCRGVAYRIAAAEARTELELLWRREMVTGAYRPTWLRTVTAGGRGWAIGFASDRRYRRYAGSLPEDRVAQVVATAEGHLGSCAAYLFDTAAHLDALGINDAALRRVRDRVKQLVGSNGKNAL